MEKNIYGIEMITSGVDGSAWMLFGVKCINKQNKLSQSREGLIRLTRNIRSQIADGKLAKHTLDQDTDTWCKSTSTNSRSSSADTDENMNVKTKR